jgi:hypothetical protein
MLYTDRDGTQRDKKNILVGFEFSYSFMQGPRNKVKKDLINAQNCANNSTSYFDCTYLGTDWVENQWVHGGHIDVEDSEVKRVKSRN